jgi:hypothetical protein
MLLDESGVKILESGDNFTYLCDFSQTRRDHPKVRKASPKTVYQNY